RCSRLFFFSSRRRHTRCLSDWSSDVCSSDLVNGVGIGYYTQRNTGPITIVAQTTPDKAQAALKAIYAEISHFNDKDYYTDEQLRSEERRVGKEYRTRWGTEHEKKRNVRAM